MVVQSDRPSGYRLGTGGMKPITGLLKWRLQARARAELVPPMMFVNKEKLSIKELQDIRPGAIVRVRELDPPIQFMPPRAQPAWRHVTQRRNHG